MLPNLAQEHYGSVELPPGPRSEAARQYLNWCLNEYLVHRWAMLKKAKSTSKPVFAIAKLAVLPDHQGKGVGAMLLRWGTDQADLHGSEVSHSMYPGAF